MPFTLSHAAAALPFRRSRLVLSALVIGTFAPDLEYFIRLDSGGGWGHTIAGAFCMDLPLGLFSLLVFHRWVKLPLAYLLPDPVRGRLTDQLAPFHFGPMRRFLLICASMLTGIATHLVWDGFTHPNYWGVRHLHFLLQQVRLPLNRYEPWYGVLQVISSVAGLPAVIVFCFLWVRRAGSDPAIPANPYTPAHRALIASSGFVVAVSGALLREWIGVLVTGTKHGRTEIVAQFVVTVGALTWWQLAVWGILGPFRHTRPAHEEETYAQSRTTALH